MAEINIERKPRKSPWPIVLAVLAVLAIAAAVWYYTQEPAVLDETTDVRPSSTEEPAGYVPVGAAA